MVETWPEAVALGWHPVASISQLAGRRPVAARLMGRSLIVLRDAKGVFVLDDRCPHRGAPLSHGRMAQGIITCPYHGWQFGRGGVCLSVPGSTLPGTQARVYASVERAGLIWVSLADAPGPFPRLPAAIENPKLDRFWWPLAASKAGLLDAIENHLDPAHPHHVHPWMVRAPDWRRPTKVHMRAGPWGAEAIYHDHGTPSGLLPRLLGRARLTSFGRYFPPTIAEVAFENASGLAFSVAVVFTPEDTGMTRPWAHFATARGRAPGWAKRLVLKALHWPILSQDRRILALQQAWRGAAPPPYATGPLDFMGPTIWRLANGQAKAESEQTVEVEL